MHYLTCRLENQTLDEVLTEGKQLALPYSVPLGQTMLLHIAKQPADPLSMDVCVQA